MGTIVEWRCPSLAFTLRELGERRPTVTATIHDPLAADHRQLPILRIQDGDRSAVTDCLRTEPSLTTVEEFGSIDGTHLYKIRWDDRVRTALAPFERAGGTIETLWATSEGQSLRVRFPTRQAVRDGYEQLRARDRSPEIDQLYEAPDQSTDTCHGYCGSPRSRRWSLS